MAPLNVAIIGLDTSHSIQFAKRMNDPECPPDQRVDGLKAVTCMRFETPFQDKEGLDGRQAELEQWGVTVTEDVDEAVADCDAIMLEINDPAPHLEYFRKVAGLGKPVFIDKPLAGSLEDGRAIIKLARKHNTRVWSGSSLPFADAVIDALNKVPEVTVGHTFGSMGTAPTGDSLIWYGVHSFEMLQKLMGTGAETVLATESDVGVASVIDYADGRRGIVESLRGMGAYGGRVQCAEAVIPFVVDAGYIYRNLLREVKQFFLGGEPPVDLETTFEGLAMMVAARESVTNGSPATVAKL